MSHHLYFSINDEVQVSTYWLGLMNYFLRSTDFIDIHVWNEEVELIEELSKKTELTKSNLHPLKLTSFQGKINDELIRYLLKDNIKDGRLKWFSIFLSINGREKFNAEHYANEFVIYEPTPFEIEFVKDCMPATTDFHEYR